MYKFENTGTGECECPKSVEAPMFVKPAVRGSLGNGACEIGKEEKEKIGKTHTSQRVSLCFSDGPITLRRRTNETTSVRVTSCGAA